MSLLPTLLAGAGGGGGGSGSVTGIILSPVVCTSTTALTVTYANGSSGVGATLTNAGAQAAISLDGVSPTVGQRVLIKNQASALQNGVYTVTTVGTGATNWVLTRSTDFDQAAEMIAGTIVEVTGGTVNAGTVWLLTTAVATVGTNSVSFISINITTKVDQNGSPIYAADSGVADVYVVTLSPAPSAYTTGMVIRFKASAANATTTPTINVNGLGAKTIVKVVSSALAANDILANQFVELIYDGTNFVIFSQLGNASISSITQGTGIQVSGSTVSSTGTTINTQTNDYALVLTDAGKIVEMNKGSANTLTVPTNASAAFAVGTIIDILQFGAGKTTVAAAGGVTIESQGSFLSLAAQYAGATLYKRGTDDWVLVGNLIA